MDAFRSDLQSSTLYINPPEDVSSFLRLLRQILAHYCKAPLVKLYGCNTRHTSWMYLHIYLLITNASMSPFSSYSLSKYACLWSVEFIMGKYQIIRQSKQHMIDDNNNVCTTCHNLRYIYRWNMHDHILQIELRSGVITTSCVVCLFLIKQAVFNCFIF